MSYYKSCFVGREKSVRIPFEVTFNPCRPTEYKSSHFQQPKHSSFFTTIPRSIFFSSSYIIAPLQKPTWHTGQGQTPQSPPPPHRSLYPFWPFYGQNRTRSSRTRHLKYRSYSQGKRSISDLQGQDPWTFWVKQPWQNLIYLFFDVSVYKT